MKTIFDKVPLMISAGETVSLSLPEPFCPNDALFLLVHHAMGKILNVILSGKNGDTVSENFTLHSFPAILVFSQDTCQQHNEDGYHEVFFTSFHDFEGSLTYRVRNPQRVMTSYRKA